MYLQKVGGKNIKQEDHEKIYKSITFDIDGG